MIIKDIYNLFYFRALHKSVWFNTPSKILFSIVLEQLPDFNNKLSLKKNTLNSNKLIIDWKIKRKDTESIKLICSAFKNAWEKSGLNKIAELKIKIPKSFTTKNNFKGAQHYTGTIKIGSRRSNSVVNKDLKLWNINNLYICSTAVFPSSSCSNTGFTLLALAARLENHLKKKINSQLK
jgi:choline dehydrogenase-like flavoprotein